MSDAVFLCPEVQSSSPAVAVAPPEFFSNKPGLVRYTVRVLNLSSLQQRPAASITVSCALTGQRAVVTARAVAGECPPGECPQFWTSRRPVPVYSAPIHPDSPSQYSGWCCPEGAALKVLPLAGRWGRLGELQSAWLTPPPLSPLPLRAARRSGNSPAACRLLPDPPLHSLCCFGINSCYVPR